MEYANHNNVSTQFTDRVQLEIGRAKLEELFRLGILCAADIRSLNNESKQAVWQLCLTACAKRILCTPIVVHFTPPLNAEVKSLPIT